MSLATLFLPFAAALVAACGVVAIARSALPARAARVAVSVLVLLAVAWVPTLVLVALAYVAHLPVVGSGFRWCAQAFGLHAAVPAWLGLPALAATVAGSVRAVALLRERRRLHRVAQGGHEVVVHPQPFAVTLPGRDGAVVLSSGLVALLDEHEREVVLAHEESHARHRHDRYLLAAELGSAVLPVLRWMADQVRLAVERWADEDAAAATGDRTLVAATLGKVALHGSGGSQLAPAFGRHGVVARVAALLGPQPGAPRRSAAVVAWTCVAVVAGLASVQLHHLTHLVAALCPH